MEVIRLDGARPSGGVACTIGTFDAVHLGHQTLLRRVVEAAGRLGARPAVVTFDRHPLEVIAPDRAPCRLGSLTQRLAGFEREGIELALVLTFDEGLAALEPETFVERILVDRLAVRRVIVGEDFRFGHGRRGDVDTLRTCGSDHGFEVEAVTLVEDDDSAVSSTVIRERVRSGDVEGAARLLGRGFRMEGEVVHGDKRGREIGFPTANVEPHARACVPGVGVYAGWWIWEGRRYPGAINVGVRPTFEPAPAPVTEIHVLDFEGDLYGRRGEVEFTARLRDELRFDSVDALVEQMRADVAEARRLLEAREPGGDVR